jgi:hypothetical protein
MTLTPAAPARAGQFLDSLPLPIDQFHREPRCRVWRNDVARSKVNEMLAAGAGYAYIGEMGRRSTSATPDAGTKGG